MILKMSEINNIKTFIGSVFWNEEDKNGQVLNGQNYIGCKHNNNIIYNNNGVCSLHRNNLDAALVYFEQGLASTTYERHLATLNYNHQELIRSMKIMKKDPNNNMKTYQGNHSFLF